MATKAELFKNLTDDLQPVKRLWSPTTRQSLWLLASFAIIIAIMLLIQGFRPEFVSQLSNTTFLLETLLGFSPAFLMGHFVFRMAVPGVKVSNIWLLLAVVCFIAFLAMLANGHWGGHPSMAPTMAGKRPFCFYEVLFLSWLPIGGMIYAVKKGYVPYTLKLGFFVGLASASIPMALMHVACMYVPEHIITHHVLGAIIPTILMSIKGYWILRPKF